MIDIERYREEFPVTKHGVFLNHAGVSPICKRAVVEIERWVKENEEAVCARYEIWARRVEEVRAKAAKFLNASPEEIGFVKNTSHGLNHVAQGLGWCEGDNIVSYNKEFPANIYPWMNLSSKGVELRLIGDRDGKIHIEDIEDAVDSRTKVIALSSVEFTTGYRNDLSAISKLCKSKDIFFCVDAIQSLGALRMDVKEFGIDFLSADAHKWLMGPEGIGIFYIRRELLEICRPAYVGWHSVVEPLKFLPYRFTLKDNASCFEEGSHNLAGIFALGGCLDLIEEVGINKIERRIIELTDFLVAELVKKNYNIISPRGNGEKSGIVSFSVKESAADVVRELAEKNIFISARDGALRVSPHFYNTKEEIEILLWGIAKMTK